MTQVRMVPFATPESAFEAKLLVARLGTVGVLCEIHGDVDGMYPLGSIEVWVAEQDLAMARELALADEVEQIFDGASGDRPGLTRSRWLLVVVVVLTVLFAVLRVAAL
jgi:hypothetical protein